MIKVHWATTESKEWLLPLDSLTMVTNTVLFIVVLRCRLMNILLSIKEKLKNICMTVEKVHFARCMATYRTINYYHLCT